MRAEDVVVVGATPAGVAAAVAAARSGASVVLIEESAHVGGIISSGLTNTDIHKREAVGGLFKEFTRGVLDHYAKKFGADSKQVKLCQDGNMFDPDVAEQEFSLMLRSEPRVRLVLRHRVVAARVTDATGHEHDAERGRRIDGAAPTDFGSPVKLVSIVAEDLSNPGKKTEFRATTFIDATYEGDLAALAGVPYRVGRESRDTFREPLAGQIYVRFKDFNPQPGSTGAADNGIQAFCFRFHLTKDPARLTPVEKPQDYRREDYHAVLDDLRAGRLTKFTQIIQLYPTPTGNFEANSDHPHPDTGVPSESLDLAEENYGWPDADPAERARIFARYWTYDEGLLWFLQRDEEVPPGIRDEALQYGFPKDQFTDHRHRPPAIYVRQGRRIWGEYNFTEHDADSDPKTGLPRHKVSAIAVAEFAFDCHAVSKFDPAHPLLRPGYFYVDHDPLQLPYGIVVPKRVDGLLVPVACSASHVGYQCIRVEPVFMALGEACGIAAKIARDAKCELRAVNIHDVQQEILTRRGVILYECQPVKPSPFE
jgi:hypothetical protein